MRSPAHVASAELVCAIDVGTTRTKVGLLDERGDTLGLADAPTPGAVDEDPDQALDPDAVFATVGRLIQDLLAQTGRAPGTIAGVAVTGQRATVIALDAEEATLGALSWQDVRAEGELGRLMAEHPAAAFQAITGLPPSPMWLCTRLPWWRREQPERLSRAARFCLVHDRLQRRLGAPDFVVDPSNAGPLGLWDIQAGDWSAPLLDWAGLARPQLPVVAPAGSRIGALGAEAAVATGLLAGTPLVLAGGDQPCATLGMGVLEPGQVGLCLGTAADLTCPVEGVAEPRAGRVCTPHLVVGQTLLEGFLSAFGVSLDWSERLGASAAEAEAPQVWPTDLPFYLPFLTGVATPDYAPTARGALLGLTPSHGPGELRLAVIDGLAMELGRILTSGAMPEPLHEVVVSGGAAAKRGLLQRIATVTGLTLVVSRAAESGLRGAAACAWSGLAGGRSPREVAAAMHETRELELRPGPQDADDEARFSEYCRQVERLLGTRPAA